MAIIGRKAPADIVIEQPEISGQHAEVTYLGSGEYLLRDLHSTNGTCINGKMIKHEQLHDGDVIAIGNFRIQYAATSQPVDALNVTTAFQALPEAAPAARARFQVVSGTSAGLEVPVVKAVTTFGKPGVAVIAVSHRRDGYYVACMEGGSQPTLNGGPIGVGGQLLSDNDVLELAGTRMLFRLD